MTEGYQEMHVETKMMKKRTLQGIITGFPNHAPNRNLLRGTHTGSRTRTYTGV